MRNTPRIVVKHHRYGLGIEDLSEAVEQAGVHRRDGHSDDDGPGRERDDEREDAQDPAASAHRPRLIAPRPLEVMRDDQGQPETRQGRWDGLDPGAEQSDRERPRQPDARRRQRVNYVVQNDQDELWDERALTARLRLEQDGGQGDQRDEQPVRPRPCRRRSRQDPRGAHAECDADDCQDRADGDEHHAHRIDLASPAASTRKHRSARLTCPLRRPTPVRCDPIGLSIRIPSPAASASPLTNVTRWWAPYKLRAMPSPPADQVDELLPDVWFASHPPARRQTTA
jgi:hypothetical protein